MVSATSSGFRPVGLQRRFADCRSSTAGAGAAAAAVAAAEACLQGVRYGTALSKPSSSPTDEPERMQEPIQPLQPSLAFDATVARHPSRYCCRALLHTQMSITGQAGCFENGRY